MFFCCCSPSASRSDVLCVQRCSSTLVVTSGNLLPVTQSISNQSGHSPLTAGINKAFLPRKEPLTRPAHLAPTTMPRSKSLKSPFFPILMFGLNFSRLTMSPCQNALSCCHVNDWQIKYLRYRAVEGVKVAGECIRPAESNYSTKTQNLVKFHLFLVLSFNYKPITWYILNMIQHLLT